MTVLESIFYSRPGQVLAAKAGLPEPPRLRRGASWPQGQIVLAAHGGARLAADTLAVLGRATGEPVIDDAAGQAAPGYGSPIGAVVVDATELRRIDDLEWLRSVLRPAIRSLEPSGRVILLARPPAEVDGLEAKAVAQALDGLNRTIGKELRKGATANLIQATDGATAGSLASTLGFLLRGGSAFVSGQTWQVGPADAPPPSPAPLAGRIVVVTGAARGIGAAITRVLARDGARVVADLNDLYRGSFR